MNNSETNVKLDSADRGSNLLDSVGENKTNNRNRLTSSSWSYNSKPKDEGNLTTFTTLKPTETDEKETEALTTGASHLSTFNDEENRTSSYLASTTSSYEGISSTLLTTIITMKEDSGKSSMNVNKEEIDISSSFVTSASTDPFTPGTEQSKDITGSFTAVSNDRAEQKENETSPEGPLKTDEILHNTGPASKLATENRILNSSAVENVAISSLVNFPVLHRQKRFSQKRNRAQVLHKKYRF